MKETEVVPGFLYRYKPTGSVLRAETFPQLWSHDNLWYIEVSRVLPQNPPSKHNTRAWVSLKNLEEVDPIVSMAVTYELDKNT